MTETTPIDSLGFTNSDLDALSRARLDGRLSLCVELNRLADRAQAIMAIGPDKALKQFASSREFDLTPEEHELLQSIIGRSLTQ